MELQTHFYFPWIPGSPTQSAPRIIHNHGLLNTVSHNGELRNVRAEGWHILLPMDLERSKNPNELRLVEVCEGRPHLPGKGNGGSQSGKDFGNFSQPI